MKNNEKNRQAEAALIADLQKQLAECLESVGLTRTETLRDRIYSSIHALFLPAREWHKERKQMEAKFIPWWFLRQFFFDTALFDNHWTSRDFRNGLDMLNDIVHIVDGDKPAVDLEHLEKYELGYRLFDYNPDEDQSKHRGMQALISALLLVRQNQDYPGIKGIVSDDVLNDMLVTLKAITFYQRLWMEAKPEVEKPV